MLISSLMPIVQLLHLNEEAFIVACASIFSHCSAHAVYTLCKSTTKVN